MPQGPSWTPSSRTLWSVTLATLVQRPTRCRLSSLCASFRFFKAMEVFVNTFMDPLRQLWVLGAVRALCLAGGAKKDGTPQLLGVLISWIIKRKFKTKHQLQLKRPILPREQLYGLSAVNRQGPHPRPTVSIIAPPSRFLHVVIVTTQ